jgi:DNA-binding response OmpR family regulator
LALPELYPKRLELDWVLPHLILLDIMATVEQVFKFCKNKTLQITVIFITAYSEVATTIKLSAKIHTETNQRKRVLSGY